MKFFCIAAFASLFQPQLIKATIIEEKDFNNIPAFSRLGSNILSKARALEEFEYDNSWLGDFSIQFQGCHSVLQYAGGEGQGGEGMEGDSKLYMQNIVKFRLCPADSCNRNCKGQYIIDMAQFAGAYVEMKEQELEQSCETVRESCYCNDDQIDDQVCENQCFMDAGLDDCIENQNDEGQGQDFEIERALECEEMEMQNENYKNYYYENGQRIEIRYFMGAMCGSNGKSVHIEVFEDAGCTRLAEKGIYEKYNYGQTLPYSRSTGTSLISSECIACKEVDENYYYNNNNNNNYNSNSNRMDSNGNYNNNMNKNGDDDYDVQLIELCEEVYEQAGKCEKGMKLAYKRNNECNFINKVLFKHDQTKRGNGSAASTFFSWAFLFSTAGLGYYSYTLHTKAKRTNVNLTDQEVGETKASSAGVVA